MSKIKTGLTIGGLSISGLVLFWGLVFGCGLFGLGYYKFFAPKYANVERDVFENTKSFTHGKIQDLAKYYEEYTKSNPEEMESIRQLIIMNFAEFDAGKINNYQLKAFLVAQRGY